MKRILFLLILLVNLALSAIAQNTKTGKATKPALHNQANTQSIFEFSHLKLIDTFTNELFKDTAYAMSIAQYSPIYIGDKNQNIPLAYSTVNLNNRASSIRDFQGVKSESIKITIDTSRIIGLPMDYHEFGSNDEYRKNKMAFPVFIENFSSDTLNIAYGDIITLIMEAKSEDGVWKPIQKLTMYYSCGTGLHTFYLAPKQICVTSMKIYAGDFHTQLRLVYLYADVKVYSNEIEGQIYRSQFE